MRAVSLWGTHLNLPRVRFKRCGGSKKAVLREKLAHKAEENIGLNQTTQSIVIIISNVGGACSECWFARQLGDTKYVLSTMGVSKESISKFLIGNQFHVKLRILSPENCKHSLQVKSWKAEVTAEKKQTQDYN